MNAAFLLVTSALLVGQAADKKTPPPANPAPPPAVASSSCGGGCSSCQDSCGCEGFGHRLRDKLRGLFSRNSCDTCQPTCHTHTPIFRSSCETACAPKWHTCHTPACAPACSDPCDRVGFLAKLRERFHRGDSCCDGGCSSCSGSTGTVAPPIPKTGEKIDPPKKMPIETPKGTDKGKQEVRFESQTTPNVIRVTPVVPSVEITPIPAPRVEGDRRDPF